MTTQEQLKIYAAYLPYGLELQIEDETETEYTMFLGEMDSIMPGKTVLAGITKETSFMPECLLFTRNDGKPDGYIQPKNAKPILYDLSHITKEIEIEHEGKVFTPIDVFEITDDHDSYSVEYDHGNIKLIRDLKSIAENNLHFDIQFLPFEVVQRLISWHFNVFGIPAGDFIEKSTLKTESNK